MKNTIPGVIDYLAAVEVSESTQRTVQIPQPHGWAVDNDEPRFASWLDLLVAACPGPLTEAFGEGLFMPKDALVPDVSTRRI